MGELKSIEKTPNKELVNVLKELLEEAEKGEIQAIAFATLNEGNGFVVGWEQGNCPILSLLGASDMLKSDITLNGMEW